MHSACDVWEGSYLPHGNLQLSEQLVTSRAMQERVGPQSRAESGDTGSVRELSPTVQRRRLSAALRAARVDTGLTQEVVAESMDWSLSKVIRIENGSVGVSTTDLRAMLALYKISDQDRAANLITLAKASRGTSWWSSYHDVLLTPYAQFIDYEAASAYTRSFELLFFPGLLQTEEYARVVTSQHASSELPTGQEVVNRLVEVRMIRQKLLDEPDEKHFHFIIDESVLRRQTGNSDIMHRQIAQLIEASKRPNVTVQILPFRVGVVSGMDISFVIMDLADQPDDRVVYLESTQSLLIKYGDPEISAYRQLFDVLRRHALASGIETTTFLRTLLKD